MKIKHWRQQIDRVVNYMVRVHCSSNKISSITRQLESRSVGNVVEETFIYIFDNKN